MKEVLEFVKSIVIAVIAALIITTFIGQSVRVQGLSMSPTLKDGDRLILEKVTYYFKEPKRGDIVVIKYPANPKEKFIKRVIGVPGDKIKIDDPNIYVNGKLQNEPYINEPMNAQIDENYRNEVTVPKGTYFVMGDNRNYSEDSRYPDVGFVEKKMVLGKTVLRIWPFNQFESIKNPNK